MSPPGAKHQIWKGRAVSSELHPTASSPGEMFFPVAACSASKQPRGWNRHQEAWTGAADTQGGELAPRAARQPSCPIPVTSSDLVAPGDRREGRARGQGEAEPQEMPCQS